MILDAGFLISVDREEHGAGVLIRALVESGARLHTTHAVLAQVWRNGARQARLASLLKWTTVHPLDDGRAVGTLLARTATDDVVDAHLVALAVELREGIITGDPDDLRAIAAAFGTAAPPIRAWP